jgi:hydroxyquinol 1,2-dioxygenase
MAAREESPVIIQRQEDVTEAVLAEAQRVASPRQRALLAAAVRHLHGFVREVQLTELEFQQICRVIARLGQCTTASHNEVVLAAGSLGLSSLVCLLNNGGSGESGSGTTANLMGPFWRRGAPRLPNGASLQRSPTPGVPIFVEAWVRDAEGLPVQEASVDVWHTSTEGFYENQDPAQADMNLRGTFTTDAQGRIGFRSVEPAGYPIPVAGPVGDLLRMQGRHNMRPAHIHFMIHKPGYKTQFSQVYSSDDPFLETDVQFGVTQALVGHYVLHDAGEAPPADDVSGPWYSLAHHFTVERGDDSLPPPPITGKAEGERPLRAVLQRHE